jgi:hypothetical protein
MTEGWRGAVYWKWWWLEKCLVRSDGWKERCWEGSSEWLDRSWREEVGWLERCWVRV